MKSFKDFIVVVPEKYSKTFKTENGLEIYMDKRWSLKKVANTIVEVVENPLNYSGEINKGVLLFVDPTLLMQQSYVLTGEQENINLIHRENNLYKVDPSYIIAYSLDNGKNWIGFGNNLLAERIKIKEPKTEKSSLVIVPENTKPKEIKGKVKIFLSNKELENQGVKKEDVVYINELYTIDIWFNQKPLIWIRNKDILGKEIKQAV